MKLAGKVAVVTGGGTGIGRAIAEALLRAGGSVVLTGRRQAPLDEGREDGLEGLALQVVEEDLRHRAADPQLS